VPFHAFMHAFMHAFEPSRARFESKKADVHTYAHTRDTRNKKTTTATTAAAATAAATPSCHIEHIADGSSGNVARAASSNASARATPPRRERVSSRRDPRYDHVGRRVGEDTSVTSASNDVVVGVVEYDAAPSLSNPARVPVVVELVVDGAPSHRFADRSSHIPTPSTYDEFARPRFFAAIVSVSVVVPIVVSIIIVSIIVSPISHPLALALARSIARRVPNVLLSRSRLASRLVFPLFPRRRPTIGPHPSPHPIPSRAFHP